MMTLLAFHWTNPRTQLQLFRLLVATFSCAGTVQALCASNDTGLSIITDKALGNCWACHALPGQQGLTSNVAPSLVGVGARYTPTQLQQWVTDARQMNAQTLMPPFGSTQGLHRPASLQPVLTPKQIALVVQTLATWR
jgi:sulfur-oxidizing protein SoxX